MSAFTPIASKHWKRSETTRCADFVAEVFCPSECVRLIQDQASMRNVDSRIHSLRFDCCVFLFYSFSAVTFATKSAENDSITLAGKRCRSAIDGTHHAAPRLRHVAIVPGDDRMHLGLGQEIGPPASTNSRAEISLEAGLVAHCSACLMSMMAAWCAAVGAPSCATDFIAARTASMCELIMSVVLRAAST